jgi:hypothetical protein
MDKLLSDLEILDIIHKNKLLVGADVRWLDPIILVTWTKRYGNNLQIFNNGSGGKDVEIIDIDYWNFIELLMEYIQGQNNKVRVLFKYSENRFFNQLQKPRIDIYLYTE